MASSKFISARDGPGIRYSLDERNAIFKRGRFSRNFRGLQKPQWTERGWNGYTSTHTHTPHVHTHTYTNTTHRAAAFHKHLQSRRGVYSDTLPRACVCL